MTVYTVKLGVKCGENFIDKNWADGSNANNGEVKGIPNCQKICNAHPECLGFDIQPVGNICMFWTSGTINGNPSATWDCHAKITGAREISRYNIYHKILFDLASIFS